MAYLKKKISELPESSSTTGLYTIGVDANNTSVKVPIGAILDEYRVDYNDIADLQSILEIKDFKVSDYGILETGRLNTTTGYKHGVLNVNEGQKFILANNHDSLNNLRYAFTTEDYNASGAVISTLVGSVGTVSHGSKAVITVPEGATVLMFNAACDYYQSSIFGIYSSKMDALIDATKKTCYTSGATYTDNSITFGEDTKLWWREQASEVAASYITFDNETSFNFSSSALVLVLRGNNVVQLAGNSNILVTDTVLLAWSSAVNRFVSGALFAEYVRYSQDALKDEIAGMASDAWELCAAGKMYRLYFTSTSFVKVDSGHRFLSIIPCEEGDRFRLVNQHNTTYNTYYGFCLHIPSGEQNPNPDEYSTTLEFCNKMTKGDDSAEVVAPSDGYIVFSTNAASVNDITAYKALKAAIPSRYAQTCVEIVDYTSKSVLQVFDTEDAVASFGEEYNINSVNYRTSDFLDVGGVGYVCLPVMYTHGSPMSINGTYAFGALWYDEEKNIIGPACATLTYIGSASSGGTGTSTNGMITVARPTEAKYIRISFYATLNKIILYKAYDAIGRSAVEDLVESMSGGSDGGYIEKIIQAKFVAKTADLVVPALGILHYSDIHGDTEAANTILDYIEEIGKSKDFRGNALIDDVLCTGDVAQTNADSGGGASWWQGCGLPEISLFTQGNHDGATSGDTAFDKRQPSSLSAWDGKGKEWAYETYIEPYAQGLGITLPTGYNDSESPNYKACFWSKAYHNQKILLIAIDSMHKFDGVLTFDPSDWTTIASQTSGMRWKTTEQEEWLISELAKTLQPDSGFYGYSVVVASHYPLDDFDGSNEVWNDSTHHFDYNNSPNGGRVMSKCSGDVVRFHSNRSLSYDVSKQYSFRNAVETSDGAYDAACATSNNNNEVYSSYTKGVSNNIANIIDNFMAASEALRESSDTYDGYFIAWVCGHTHADYMYYPNTHPNILNIVINQAGWQRQGNTGDRQSGKKCHTCANYVAFDTQNKRIKIVRLGFTIDSNMTSREYLCYDYKNRRVIGEG